MIKPKTRRAATLWKGKVPSRLGRERRKTRRISVGWTAAVFPSDSRCEPINVRIQDVSTTGVGLRARGVPVSERVFMILETGGGESLCASGRVTHVTRPRSGSGSSVMGVEFIDLSIIDAERIKALVASAWKVDRGRK